MDSLHFSLGAVRKRKSLQQSSPRRVAGDLRSGLDQKPGFSNGEAVGDAF